MASIIFTVHHTTQPTLYSVLSETKNFFTGSPPRLNLYNLTSECIFYQNGEFVSQSRAFVVDDHFHHFHDWNVSFSGDFGERK